MQQPNASLWIVITLLLLSLAGVAAYKAWPLLYPEVAATLPVDSTCDLRKGPCTSKLPSGGSIQFGIGPNHIPPLAKLQLEVVTDGVEASAVEVDFSGIDMKMGFNRPRLESIGQGRFQGEGMLPVCIKDSMEWEARVLVQTDEGTLAAPYRFLVRKVDQLSADEGGAE